ncbi:DUF4430 domain-containing protein [Anaerocolumna sp.]|uniref:DUF4430 domain-containing protein n=1 Tax=Anaerocolumna sp. TaxID=2041569 RepID=UPI0028AC652B|nr:DUF4430 domain-containing protein [Anaerocolumna sp.]
MSNKFNIGLLLKKSVLLCLVALSFLLMGCKIEKPQDVRRENVGAIEQDLDGINDEAVNSEDVSGNRENLIQDNYLDVNDIASTVEDYSKYGIASDTEEFSKYEKNKDLVHKETVEENENKKSTWNHDNDRANLKFNDLDQDGRDDTTGLDKYLTDPIPEGKPHPVEAQDTIIDKDKLNYCTLSIRCDTILENRENLDEELLYLLDKDGIKDGVIYEERKVQFYEGESVFDILLRETKAEGIHMEFTFTPMYNSHYIEGINNFYEFSCGELSGWMYKVNDWFPNYGCSRYQLKDGDKVEWVYTCDLGRDVGCDWLGGTKE